MKSGDVLNVYLLISVMKRYRLSMLSCNTNILKDKDIRFLPE